MDKCIKGYITQLRLEKRILAHQGPMEGKLEDYEYAPSPCIIAK